MSGTTAITAFFKGTQFTVANIGDSRAVVGEKKGKRVIAYSLSIDQTPYRQDERERVKASGAVVMSCDQLEGIVPYHENWGVVCAATVRPTTPRLAALRALTAAFGRRRTWERSLITAETRRACGPRESRSRVVRLRARSATLWLRASVSPRSQSYFAKS